MRKNLAPDKVKLAVVRAIMATFDRSKWLELGLLTGTLDAVSGHRRLLRSLDFGDDDYQASIIEVMPAVLGERRHNMGHSEFTNLTAVEEYIGLPDWLRKNDARLFDELYGGSGTHEAATDELQVAAQALGLTDVDEHAARIRRGLREDPPQAIGSAKELLETVFKAILGLSGGGKDTRLDLPQLAKSVNVKLGLDDQGRRGGEPGAKQRRGVLKGLNSIVDGISEIRNEGFGTGHGVFERPELDIATARLVVTAAAAAATFYIEIAALERPAPRLPRVEW